MAIAPEINRLFVAAQHRLIYVWDLKDGELVTQYDVKVAFEPNGRAYLGYDREHRRLYANSLLLDAAPWEREFFGVISGTWRAHYEATRTLPMPSAAARDATAVIHRGVVMCDADIDDSIGAIASYLERSGDEEHGDPEGVLLDDSLVTGSWDAFGVEKFVRVVSIHGRRIDSPRAIHEALVQFREDWHADPNLPLRLECQGDGTVYRHVAYVRPTERITTEASLMRPVALMLLRSIVDGIAQVDRDVMRASLEWHPGVQLDNAPSQYRAVLEKIGFAIDDILLGVDGIPLVTLENFDRAFGAAIAGVESGSRNEIRYWLKRGGHMRVEHTIRIE